MYVGSKLCRQIGLIIHKQLKSFVAFPKLGVLELVTVSMYFYCYFLVCNYSVGRWENRNKWELLDDACSCWPHWFASRRAEKQDFSSPILKSFLAYKYFFFLQACKDCSYYLYLEDSWPGQESDILIMWDINPEFSLCVHMLGNAVKDTERWWDISTPEFFKAVSN